MPSRIVVLAPNWLGDAVMSLPAVRDVQAGSPGVAIAVAARAVVAPLFRLVDGIAVVPLDDRGALRRGGFDCALLLPNSFHTALAVYRAGIPERWGYRGDWRRPLLTRAVPRPSRGHQIDYYQHLTEALGFPRGDAQPHLNPGPGARERGAAVLRAAGWNGRDPLVTMAPGAAYGSAKRWPPEHFADLAAALASDGVAVAMVGSPADARTGAVITTALAGRARLLDLIGRTDLEALCGVLAASRTLVTNDSGAMHVGAALGVPVTAVFGPTREVETGPRNLDPLRPVHRVLVNDVWCRPCMERECPLDHRCMRGLAPAVVLESARRVL